MFRLLLLLSVLSVPSVVPHARAAEPFLKPNDVIALVGGEDMVAASEYGYLELLLQRALPEHRLKVRSLAWEGDTVFEQPRELNYPTLEAQLDEIGATVVIMQFGQMESLAGTSKLPEFIQAYEKLIERVSAGGKRRVVLMSPFRPSHVEGVLAKHSDDSYMEAIIGFAQKPNGRVVYVPLTAGQKPPTHRLDKLHVAEEGHAFASLFVSAALALENQPVSPMKVNLSDRMVGFIAAKNSEEIRQLIATKNRLWFHYYRPQNWAFLNGDRTEQPSSRDHKDPSKRWFPEEMKQFLSLVEAKEKEIWDLAAKASAK